MHCTVVFINFTKNFWIRRSSRNGPQTVNIEFKVLCNLLQTLIGEKGGEDVLVYLPLTIAGSCFLKKSYIDAYNPKEHTFIMNAIRFLLSRDAFYLESKKSTYENFGDYVQCIIRFFSPFNPYIRYSAFN